MKTAEAAEPVEAAKLSDGGSERRRNDQSNWFTPWETHDLICRAKEKHRHAKTHLKISPLTINYQFSSLSLQKQKTSCDTANKTRCTSECCDRWVHWIGVIVANVKCLLIIKWDFKYTSLTFRKTHQDQRNGSPPRTIFIKTNFSSEFCSRTELTRCNDMTRCDLERHNP